MTQTEEEEARGPWRQRLEWCGYKPRMTDISTSSWKKQRNRFSTKPPERTQPSDLLIQPSEKHFRFLSSRTVREYVFVVLSHQVCYSHLLQQPQDTNTSRIEQGHMKHILRWAWGLKSHHEQRKDGANDCALREHKNLRLLLRLVYMEHNGKIHPS